MFEAKNTMNREVVVFPGEADSPELDWELKSQLWMKLNPTFRERAEEGPLTKSKIFKKLGWSDGVRPNLA